MKTSLGELIANAVSHGVGVFLGIAGLVMLIVESSKSGNVIYVISAIVYGVSITLLYSMSTLFHSFPEKMKKTFKVFQRLDHSGIYVLVAGTYTPYCIVVIGGELGLRLLIVQWSLAVIGIILKALWVEKFNYIHIVIFLAMGWAAILYINEIMRNLEMFGVVCLVLGGLFYSLGVIFYIVKFKYQHFVWHIFVLLGSIFHFISIYGYVY